MMNSHIGPCIYVWVGNPAIELTSKDSAETYIECVSLFYADAYGRIALSTVDRFVGIIVGYATNYAAFE